MIAADDHPIESRYYTNQNELLKLVIEYAKNVYKQGDIKDSERIIYLKSIVLITLSFLEADELIRLQALSK
jgi:hypothetical protein